MTEHTKLVQQFGTWTRARAVETGADQTEIANKVISAWTNGKCKDAMRWFQDTSGAHVELPEEFNMDTASAQAISEACIEARVEVASRMIATLDDIDLSEGGTEVSVEPAEAEPEAEPEPEDKPTEVEEAEPKPKLEPKLAAAVAKLKAKKQQSSPAAAEKLDSHEERLDSIEGHIGRVDEHTDKIHRLAKLAENQQGQIDAIKDDIEATASTNSEDILGIKNDIAELKANLEALLEAIQ